MKKQSLYLKRIDIRDTPEMTKLLAKIEREFGAKPGPVPSEDVVVKVPKGLIRLAAYLGKQQGMSGKKLMSALLNEQLYEAWKIARKQHRDAIGF